MKKTIILSLCLMLLSGALKAQSKIGGVTLGTPAIEKVGETVSVRFRATIDKKAVRHNHSLVLAPEITNGSSRWSLRPIIIHGRGAKVSLERQALASDKEEDFKDVLLAKNGQTVEYTASVPYQQWMDGARLSMEATLGGCCSSEMITPQTLVADLGIARMEPLLATSPAPVHVPTTTGEILAATYPFVTRVGSINDVHPMTAAERENTITVYYKVSRSNIEPDYANNYRSLGDILYSIRKIGSSADSEVVAIMIAGFASPEGGVAINNRLAGDRALEVKEHIIRNSNIEPNKILVHNGQSDWEGLRQLVEQSEMSWREVVLAIIDNYPIWDATSNAGRLGELMRLDGGRPYRYMLEHFFPKLRNAAYIKVYYKNTKQ